MKFEVEFALFKKCIIEADNLRDANEKAHRMEDDEIKETCTETEGYIVWKTRRKKKPLASGIQ